MSVLPSPSSATPPASLAPPPPEFGAGVNRRDFVRVCLTAAAAVGLSGTAAAAIAEAVARGVKPSVIWLHFQECTGCTESLLRTSHPDVAALILDLISLDYHETLFAAAGHQAEDALKKAMADNKGKYVCVVEGAIPTKDDGIYCMIGGRTALDIVNEVAADAGAIIAIGSCASWGGMPSADPNPTGATGRAHGAQGQDGRHDPRLPGESVQPARHRAPVRHAEDAARARRARAARSSPTAAPIHEHCPRRAHFDAGRFAQQFGDEGHRQGYCLYKLGCKGPATHANCSMHHFGEVVDAWPIGLGHPCFGCTEQKLAFRVPLHDTVDIERPTPPDTYPGISTPQGNVSAVATGIVGTVVGAGLGAGYVASKQGPERRSAQRRRASRRTR